MKKGAMLTVIIVISALMLSFIAFPLSATAQGPDSTEKIKVVSALGKIPGKDLIVHVWVVVPPGADKNEAANKALKNQGARPFTQDEFSTISLFWDQFSDSDPGNDFVTQNYNSNNDPTIDQGKITLLKTHTTWNDVVTSSFNFVYGEDTTRCPSLVQECPGSQTFDGYNDVAWLELAGSNTLGVAWSGTSIDEVDIALNTKFPWNTDGSNYDVETVYLHENGHALGLGHSNVVGAVMEPVYAGERRSLHQDDIDGITFLYPSVSNNPPSVTITSPVAGSIFDSGATINFAGSASDAEDGDLTADLVWTSDKDGPIGTGGSFPATLSDGNHDITATVTDSGGMSGSASVSVMVQAPTTGTSTIMHVHDISFNPELKGKKGKAHLNIVVTIQDSNHAGGVEGATVQLKLTGTDGTNASGSGTTNSNGDITFNYKKAIVGVTYTAEVVNVLKVGSIYDPTLNEETSDSVTI